MAEPAPPSAPPCPGRRAPTETPTPGSQPPRTSAAGRKRCGSTRPRDPPPTPPRPSGVGREGGRSTGPFGPAPTPPRPSEVRCEGGRSTGPLDPAPASCGSRVPGGSSASVGGSSSGAGGGGSDCSSRTTCNQRSRCGGAGGSTIRLSCPIATIRALLTRMRHRTVIGLRPCAAAGVARPAPSRSRSAPSALLPAADRRLALCPCGVRRRRSLGHTGPEPQPLRDR